MASTAKKQTARGRKQDRARVAGGQEYEVRYEAKKTGKSASAVKKTVKKVGNSRKKVEKTLKPGRTEHAELLKQQPTTDPGLTDPKKTPGSGMTPENGPAPSG